MQNPNTGCGLATGCGGTEIEMQKFWGEPERVVPMQEVRLCDHNDYFWEKEVGISETPMKHKCLHTTALGLRWTT